MKKAVKLERAMVRRSRVEQAVIRTPFAAFIMALLEREMSVVRSLDGRTMWSGLPLEQVLAEGLVLIIKHTAKKLGLNVQTEHETVERILPRLERLINAGIIMVHGNPERAALAFEAKVVPAVERRTSEERRQIGVAAEPWRVPVSEFFATMLKRAQEEGLKVARLGETLDLENTMDARADLRVLNSQEWLAYKEQAALLTLECERTIANPLLYAELASYGSRLQGLSTRQSLLRKMPVLSAELPEPLTELEYGEFTAKDYRLIEREWINTQLLITAGQLRRKEWIDSRDYARAVKSLHATGDATVIRRFLARMHSRGMKLPPDEERLLKQVLQTRLNKMRADVYPDGSLIWGGDSRNIPYGVFVQVRSEHLVINPVDALEEAGADENAVLGIKIRSKRRRNSPELLAEKVPWGTLDESDFTSLVAGDRLSIAQLAKGILKMPEEEKRRAAEQLLMDMRTSMSDLLPLYGAGLIKVDADLIMSHLNLIPVELLDAYVAQILDSVAESGEAGDIESHTSADAFLTAFKRLPAKRVRELLGQKRVRSSMVLFAEECLMSFINRMDRKDNQDKEMPQFRKLVLVFLDQIGEELWQRYVLAWALFYTREDEYQKGLPEEHKDLKALPRWEDLADVRVEGFTDIRKVMRARSAEEARAVLKRLPEDRVFAWLYAAKPDMKKQLAEFRANRTRYYASFAEPEKPKTKSAR